MKTKNPLIFCALVVIFVAGYSMEASAQCSDATLIGTYIYSGIGNPTPTGTSLYLESGMESYDGKGKVHNVYSSNSGTGPVSFGRATAIYNIKSNCTGTVNYGSGEDIYDIFVSPDGSSFTYIKVGGTDTQIDSGTENRVSMSQIVKPET
jgi:hypothetical protein